MRCGVLSLLSSPAGAKLNTASGEEAAGLSQRFEL
jgi:hypothetical protein